MNYMKLITPTKELVTLFNSYWTQTPDTFLVPLFCDRQIIDIREYVKKYSNFVNQDEDILKKTTLEEFFDDINTKYSTGINNGKIPKIIKKLQEKHEDIKTLEKFKEKINKCELSLDAFVDITKEATEEYKYSFATKVYSFINDSPILDSYAVTILDAYEYNNKIPRNKWGNYKSYCDNYIAFKKAFNLEELTNKKVDRFLWTYGKTLEAYWQDIGVLSFSSVQYDIKNKDKNKS